MEDQRNTNHSNDISLHLNQIAKNNKTLIIFCVGEDVGKWNTFDGNVRPFGGALWRYLSILKMHKTFESTI